MNDYQEMKPQKSQWDLVKVIYLFYALGLFTAGAFGLVGVLIAHLKSGKVDPVIQSHLDYQIRTFWYGIILIIIGLMTMVFLVGFILLFLVGLWELIRIIKGFLRANEGAVIENPETWLF